MERRYRRLLRAYPAAYRRRRGDELPATLLEAAAPGQRHPTLRETLGLLGGGLSARAGMTGGCTPRTLLLVAVLLLAVLLWLPIDPRPAIAAAVYIAPLLGGYLVTAIQYRPTLAEWWTCCPHWPSPPSPGRLWPQAPPAPATCPDCDPPLRPAPGRIPAHHRDRPQRRSSPRAWIRLSVS